MKRTVYRDSKTGRFVSRSTWNRSKGQGGQRYKRQSIPIAKEPSKAPAPGTFQEWLDEHEDDEIEEITGGFDTGKSKKR